MNTCGQAISRQLSHCNPDAFIVVHDELEMVLGKHGFKNGGSHNGHNGLKSIVDSLSSKVCVFFIGSPLTFYEGLCQSAYWH